MGWENRATRQYYYRKRRVNGRVVSEYVGSGIYAELASWMDEDLRADRARMMTEQKQARDEFMDLSRQIDRVSDELRSLTNTVLRSAGYYTHKGQWRRRRERA